MTHLVVSPCQNQPVLSRTIDALTPQLTHFQSNVPDEETDSNDLPEPLLCFNVLLGFI